MGMTGYSVDMNGDELMFNSVEEAKKYIDEVNVDDPPFEYESLDECDGTTQMGDMGEFNTNILDWGIM